MKAKIYKKWTQQEIDYLKENYGKISAWKIAERLNKTPKQVTYQANKLILKTNLHNGINLVNWNRNKIGKDYEEIYGKEKAKEIKEKMSNKRIGMKFSEEHKRNLSVAHLNKTEDEKTEHIKKILENRKMSPNEIIMNNIIKENNFPFNYTGNGKIVINGFCPDFLSKNPKHIIELFGSKHYSPYDKKRDKRRFKAYSSLGYKTLVIHNWEFDESHNHRINIINKIKEFIK